ncbi:hypothetical protein [Variovorax sp. PAMC26660]|uniref:hypothetical protein n=1 Tax=Variovorax sp. PAMC26660 TaxID=2762322 RepID=UPI00164CE15C|nr:hypothetical protein [Variovorax sp. PAMC26660]QNK69673.1 hypothetical protein H7F35_08255 [Variovorax sp. PAMC26660]
MPKLSMHTATVTISLPSDIGSDEEIAALRIAGIPVDALGNAQFGYLFVRNGGGSNRRNIFRWFAGGLPQEPPLP